MSLGTYWKFQLGIWFHQIPHADHQDRTLNHHKNQDELEDLLEMSIRGLFSLNFI
jgi:hypothetical protein